MTIQRVPGQSFDELPFEEEILDFLRFLGHSAQIKTLSDVNINKLFQPWRSFVAVINSLRLSQAQILWGLYHRRNVDYAFLIWEDFVYQVEHKNQKKSNEMYYPRFTKVITHHFMMKKPLIPRQNKVNWNYVRDDILFSTMNVVSRHQNTQQYGVILPIELTTEDIRNTKAYKEYYACATGEAAPKPKASTRRKRGGSDSSTTPPTVVASPRPITTIAAASRLTAFLVTVDVPEIYMQEFWATAYVHQHSIRFKMDTRKNIVDLEAFRKMLHISPRVSGQSFDDLPFEEEILDFLRFLGHSAQIKTLTDVNVNKLFQPWRSFAAVINKCLTGKSSGFDSLRWNTKIRREAMKLITLDSRKSSSITS
nr:hypothetical protein [Tanacetum cinerariifolium]